MRVKKCVYIQMVGECELMTVCNNYNAISRSDDPKGKIK